VVRLFVTGTEGLGFEMAYAGDISKRFFLFTQGMGTRSSELEKMKAVRKSSTPSQSHHCIGTAGTSPHAHRLSDNINLYPDLGKKWCVLAFDRVRIPVSQSLYLYRSLL